MNRCFIKKLFLIISQYSQENTCVGVFFNENAGLQSYNFIKKRLQHKGFPVNIAKFCDRLFARFSTWTSNITSTIGSKEDIFSKTKQKKNILKLN